MLWIVTLLAQTHQIRLGGQVQFISQQNISTEVKTKALLPFPKKLWTKYPGFKEPYLYPIKKSAQNCR